MRPLIAAEPMLRAPSPANVSESTFTGARPAVGVWTFPRAGIWTVPPPSAFRGAAGAFESATAAACGSSVVTVAPGVGLSKRLSGISELASIRSHTYFALSALELPLAPISKENGRYQPLTSL